MCWENAGASWHFLLLTIRQLYKTLSTKFFHIGILDLYLKYLQENETSYFIFNLLFLGFGQLRVCY